MGEIIHIDWDGPYSLEDLKGKTPKLSNEEVDHGIYQVYGRHILYGGDILLYIGKAAKQTFKTRILQEGWAENQDSKRLSIYVGRLAGQETPTNTDWSIQIDLCESLLIYAHSPALNSKGINTIPDEDLKDIHVLNWGNHRDLLPEVSGARWTTKYDEMEEYGIYGEI